MKNMKSIKKLALLVVCWLFSSLSANLYSQTVINLNSAGTLKNVAKIDTVTNLTVTGVIDARDIAFMRDSIPNLAELDLSGTAIVEYTGANGTYPSPWSNNSISYLANEIPEHAFYNCISLTSIILPDGVTSIAFRAFAGCSNLVSITIPDGVISIIDSVFTGCSSLSSITLPAGVTYIGTGEFSGCSSLTSINIPNGVTSIRWEAFSGCSRFTSITLPAGITSIKQRAFSGCNGLVSITNLNPTPVNIDPDVFYGINQSACTLRVPANAVAAYQSAAVWKEFNIAGIGFSLSVNVNDSVFGSVTGTPNGLYSQDTTIYLRATPATGCNFVEWTSGGHSISANPVLNFQLTSDTVITAVFANSGNYAVTPGTLKDIPGIELVTHLTLTGAIDARDVKFMRDNMPNLAELDLSGVAIAKYIGEGGTHPSSDSVSYPANEVPEYSFYNGDTRIENTSLVSVILPNGITSIGNFAFYSCSALTSLNIPDGVRYIGWVAIRYCRNLPSVTVPGSVDSIGMYAFLDCDKLTSITVDENNTKYSSIEGVLLNKDKTVLLMYPIGKTGSYVIPSSVTTIYDGAFFHNKLTSLTIPGSLTNFDDPWSSFVNLTSITNYSLVPQTLSQDIFYADKDICVIRVPLSAVNAYRNAAVWKEYNIAGGYSITGKAGEEKGNVSGSGIYEITDSVTLTATPDPGYRFTGWTVWTLGGHPVSTDNPFTFNITIDTVMYANFAAIIYNIIYELNGGTNPVGNPATYTVEDTIVLKAPAKQHYDFAGWAEGDSIIINSYGDKTLTALWKATRYTITYVLSGGVNHAGNPATYTVEDSVILQAPSRSGYEFTGWLEGDMIFAGSTGARTFTAQWSETVAFNITYILNGGTNHADNPVVYTVDDSIVLKAPTRTGYDFAGWTEGNTIPAGSAGDKTFTAEWTTVAYSIAYELNGGANHSGNPATYTIEDTIILQVPSKTGYDFAGWTGDTVIVNSTGDKTLTALWTAIKYAIVYELNGGANHSGNPATYTVEDSVVLRSPAKAGYNFAGWSGDSAVIVKGSTGARSYAATWSLITYSITYELSGGANHSGNPATYTVEDTIILQAPSKTGYAFAGWTGDTVTVNNTGDKTLTALWEVIKYSIVYGLDGGANHAGNPAIYTVEDSIVLNHPAKPGYIFKGWTEGNEIVKGSTGDRTFTAEWEIVVYNIVYELDGGVNHPDNPATYTVNDAITLKAPSREEFVFDGWAGDSIIVKGSMGDKIFTARWKSVEAKIEEIVINGVDVDITDSEDDHVIEYTVQDCEESSISLDLEASSATVTINGEAYAPGTEIALTGDVTTVNIEIESETGDNSQSYQLNVASPLTTGSLYYQRWSDVIAVNRNPATNGGYEVSDVRWNRQDGTAAGSSDFIVVQDNETPNDYYPEVEVTTEDVKVWHKVCATAETRTTEKIVAYPNPVSRGERVSVQLPESFAGSVLNIYSIKGSLVKSGLPLPVTSAGIDVSELTSGIYLLHITNRSGNSEVVKMIVE
jgi:uncharacterized repeat protein (TIGR02543 family)